MGAIVKLVGGKCIYENRDEGERDAEVFRVSDEPSGARWRNGRSSAGCRARVRKS